MTKDEWIDKALCDWGGIIVDVDELSELYDLAYSTGREAGLEEAAKACEQFAKREIRDAAELFMIGESKYNAKAIRSLKKEGK